MLLLLLVVASWLPAVESEKKAKRKRKNKKKNKGDSSTSTSSDSFPLIDPIATQEQYAYHSSGRIERKKGGAQPPLPETVHYVEHRSEETGGEWRGIPMNPSSDAKSAHEATRTPVERLLRYAAQVRKQLLISPDAPLLHQTLGDVLQSLDIQMHTGGTYQPEALRAYLKAILRQDVGWYDTSNPEQLSTTFAECMGTMQKGFKSIPMIFTGLTCTP